MYTIRPITFADNTAVATIIRTVMPEFDCVGEGYSIEDPEVDQMYQKFSQPGHRFFVIVENATKKVCGCGGFAPLAGNSHPTVCELQKMYFLTPLRGKGLGKQLLELCIQEAQLAGYQKMYLETVARMVAAGRLYQKMGFTKLDKQMGATGHSGCDSFMIRDI